MTAVLRKKISINMVFQAAVFVSLIALDQLTKYFASKFLINRESVVIINNVLELKYLENTGAAFGIFKNMIIMFYILTAVVMILIAAIWIRNNKKLRVYAGFADSNPEIFISKTYSNVLFLNYLIAVLAAGAIGNLIDRIRFEYVVDFIFVKLINFPIFNFADICVTVSAVILVIFFMLIYKDDENFKLFASLKNSSQDEQ